MSDTCKLCKLLNIECVCQTCHPARTLQDHDKTWLNIKKAMDEDPKWYAYKRSVANAVPNPSPYKRVNHLLEWLNSPH